MLIMLLGIPRALAKRRMKYTLKKIAVYMRMEKNSLMLLDSQIDMTSTLMVLSRYLTMTTYEILKLYLNINLC